MKCAKEHADTLTDAAGENLVLAPGGRGETDTGLANLSDETGARNTAVWIIDRGEKKCMVEPRHLSYPGSMWPGVPADANGGCCKLVATPCEDLSLYPAVGAHRTTALEVTP
jgi:hypothetical protein